MRRVTSEYRSAMSNEKSAALDALVGCGRFQFLLFICSQWVIFAQAWNLMAIVFNKSRPKWTCVDNGTSRMDNVDQCAIRETCTNLSYTYEYRSIVMEWDLMCEKEHAIYLIMTIQMTGVLVGAPIFGQLSDWFGRKWTLFGEVLGVIVFGFATAFSPSWKVYSVLIFFVGFFCGGSIVTSYVLWVELMSQKHRLWVPAAGGWPVAFVLFSLIGYLTREWRTLVITINLISIPSLALVLLVGESPRWLLGSGRVDEAVVRLRRVTRINRSKADEAHYSAVIDAKLRESESSGGRKKYTYWHLFSTKKMAVQTIVLSITFFCLSATSYGLTFTLDKLSGSIYLNFFFLSCLRWLGSVLTIVADVTLRKYGRRVGVILPAFIISAFTWTLFVLMMTVPTFSALPSLIRAFLLSSAAFCSPMWTAMTVNTNELFPTPIRNMAVAFVSISNRLGSVIMPQILYLALYWKPCPYLAFAVLTLVCGVLYFLFIPETKGHPLPQRMPEKANRKGPLAVYKFSPVDQAETNSTDDGASVVIAPCLDKVL